jgi:branched-chain amino acid transport system substrate-binding protein
MGYTPGEAEYSVLVSKMQAAGIEIFFPGGYHRDAGLIIRQARDRGYDLRLVANSAMALEDFPMIAGPGLQGTIMVSQADMRASPQAAEVVARFRAQGYEPLGHTLSAYTAIQVWAQAAKAAGALDLDALTAVMHSRQFDTVLGKIGFDAKGDVTGFEPWQWFVWQADGTYVPLAQGAANK